MGRHIMGQVVALAVPPLLALLTAPVLARALGVDGRGALAAGTATLLFLSAVLTFGLQESVTHHVAKHPGGERATVLRAGAVIAGLGLLGGLATWACAPWLAGGDSGITAVIRLTAAFVTPTLLLIVPRALAAGQHAWSTVSLESWVNGLLKTGLILLLWATGSLTVVTAAAAVVLAPIAAGMVYVPIVLQALRTPSDPAASPATGTLLGYGLRIWVGSLSGIVLSRVDQVLMVPLSDETQLGLYAVAVTVGEVPTVISAAVRNVVFASDSADSDTAATATRLQQAARLATAGSAAGALALGATMHWWIPWLFGPDFAAAWTAAAILLLATVVGTAGSVAGAGLSARGRPGLRSLSMTVGAVANLTLFLTTIGPWGVVGAALSTLVGAWVSGTGNIVFLRRVFGIPAAGFYGLRREDVELVGRLVRRIRGRGAPA